MTRPPFPSLPASGRRRPDVAALLAMVAALWLFALLSLGMTAGWTAAFDETVLLALRGADGHPLGPAWLQRSLRDVTALGGYPVVGLIAAVALGYLVLRRSWRSALAVPLVVVAGIALNQLLKAGFDRARPDLVAHLVDVQTLSYPSGHAMVSAVVYLSLGVLLAGAQARRPIRVYVMAVAAGLVVLVGASRVYLGVHWPSDVLAGWSAGAALALAAGLVLQRRSGDPAQDDPGPEPGREA